MKIEIALAQIFSEIDRAEKLHPDWPSNPIHQAAIVTEEGIEKGDNHGSHSHGGKCAPVSQKRRRKQ